MTNKMPIVKAFSLTFCDCYLCVAFSSLSFSQHSAVTILTSMPAVKLTGDDADKVKEVVRTIGATIIAKATKCRRVSKEVDERLRDGPIPGVVESFWFCCNRQEELEGNDFFKMCLTRMKEAGNEPLHVSLDEARTNHKSLLHGNESASERFPTQDENQCRAANEATFNANFCHASNNFSLFGLSLLPHLGFDCAALKKNEFRLWLTAQPPVNREVSIERLTKNSSSDFGLLDAMVKNREKGALDKCMKDIVKQGCHISLYALGSTNDPPANEGSSQVAMKCMIRMVTGEKVGYNGNLWADSAPRACSLGDMNEIFKVLAGKRVSHYVDMDDSKSKESNMLLVFQRLQEIYDHFQKNPDPALVSNESLLGLYVLLSRNCGLPQVSDDNKAAHKHLVPRSIQEMTVRIILMHHSLFKLRGCIQNGQGRLLAIRHATTSTTPTSKPLDKFARGEKEECKLPDEAAAELLHQLQSKVFTTVCLSTLPKKAVWHEHVVQSLFDKSTRDLEAADKAAPVELVQVLAKMTKGIAERTVEFNYRVKSKKEGEEALKTKDPCILFKQLMWHGLEQLYDSKDIKAMGGAFGSLAEDYVKRCLENGRMRKTLVHELDDSKDKLVAAVRDLRDNCCGCEALDEKMVTDKFGFEEKDLELPNQASLVKRIVSHPNLLAAFAYHTKNPTNFPLYIGKVRSAPGDPSVPNLYKLNALLTGFLVHDLKSARVAHDFVNNNGSPSSKVPPHAQTGSNGRVKVSILLWIAPVPVFFLLHLCGLSSHLP